MCSTHQAGTCTIIQQIIAAHKIKLGHWNTRKS
jgi:hypothetical protein